MDTELKAIDIDAIINTMADELAQMMERKQIVEPLMIGVHTGGLWVAEKLHQKLGLNKPLGEIDISFYRDDFSRIGLNPQVKPSNIPAKVENEHIILVDDVLYTGRTIRAALNEIFDYGRPDSVTLAVLVDRGARELPLHADIVGVKLDLLPEKQVKLIGPAPLALETNRN
ncbi:MAG: pyrimidine operon attenuation protein/uracil phosphoribosyltransferase [Cycloclasticus pugetii]|jgi:pyrimidine operon attenuation protein/uracil phosphoribosyltransferase|uniref:Uracil phosphoribosyltransferase/pyrimidine operon regulatory protein PyrR n=2 Tax=Cycloclasticus TaxID=34067 RepID=S5TUB8_9GAMM|nr:MULTISPECIES: bifunctional pyr operon transcriptional regulator/uracil phosphoribosyltransferase PyrR [Cycloclasticus]AFT68183.1 Uracil phosphoribosyltransferase / Pyrimidine operon regulatory protein PyrR [Cycloclasticus sp. P1]AGS38615.1 Uracil phosphoribosyltransferase/pyrimidine operon regulatory protein PyrR [Cycloclasticus zancles 78-ME]ATI02286.1 bifunctional pyr operon transcriptional regulator/uracil phosphoribosyltransferase PyrR [Cycloclasticus sp. PY97N]EPD12372.1 uracil phosphor|tara:strand:+ start:1697 stop:2209 length:513 start_codon:yes stop_codon:yes gene_type:complete